MSLVTEVRQTKMFRAVILLYCCQIRYVSLREDNIDTIKKNTETLIDASKEVCLEGNPEKTKYVLLSRHQNENAGQNHDITIVNRSLENVAQFRYLGTTVTNQT
jgi:hypothetical protein